MARDIDMTKPLSEEDVAWLKERHPLEYVNHLVQVASEGDESLEDFDDEDLDISTLDEEALRELSRRVGAVVDQVTSRADELEIELEEFPTVGPDENPAPEPQGTPDGGSTPELFDPSSKDVEGVLEYLMTASDEETARVKEAEAAGKKRKGVLDA